MKVMMWTSEWNQNCSKLPSDFLEPDSEPHPNFSLHHRPECLNWATIRHKTLCCYQHQPAGAPGARGAEPLHFPVLSEGSSIMGASPPVCFRWLWRANQVPSPFAVTVVAVNKWVLFCWLKFFPGFAVKADVGSAHGLVNRFSFAGSKVSVPWYSN